MVQLPFEALFTVGRQTFKRFGYHSGRRCKEEEVVPEKSFNAADFEDAFATPPRPLELEEPCAEPDVEPAPVDEVQLPLAIPRKTWSRAAVAGFAVVLILVTFIGIEPLLAPETLAPSSAPAAEQAAEQGSSLADDAVIAKASEPQVGNQSSTYTVGLTRHSFPVNKVGDITYYRSAYFGTVHVGSPAVPFKVVFDTGSGHLILPSTYCQSETCRAHRRYRGKDSSTSKDIDYDGSVVAPGQPRDQITVSFGTGEVTGVFIEDVVCMNGEDPAEAISNSSVVATSSGALDRGCVKLRVIAATAMSEEPFKTFAFDGVLGLGLDGLSQAPEFNYLDVLASSFGGTTGNTPHTFAVFLAEDEEEESKITFGGWDDDVLTNDLSWSPVLDPEQGHWTIRIKSLRINGEVLEICHEGCKGVVDTGTSLLAVPAVAFSELYTLLRHPAPMEGHCHGPGPQLHIELDDFTITLGPEDYSRLERTPPRKTRPRFESTSHNVSAQGRTDLHCKPMLMSLDLPEPLGPKLFILGEPVLRKYYSVYDAEKERVGFSRARHHSRPSSLLRPDMTPALKKDAGVAEQNASERRSMFDVFRWRKLHRYS